MPPCRPAARGLRPGSDPFGWSAFTGANLPRTPAWAERFPVVFAVGAQSPARSDDRVARFTGGATSADPECGQLSASGRIARRCAEEEGGEASFPLRATTK